MNTEGTLDFQIALEQRVAKIYQRIADQFSHQREPLCEKAVLWKKLARDERKHAALLKIEKALLQSGTRVMHPVEITHETKQKIEAMLSKYEKQISGGINEAQAFQILKDLETCDEHIFLPLLQATDSKLLSRFARRSETCQAHEKRVRDILRQNQ